MAEMTENHASAFDLEAILSTAATGTSPSAGRRESRAHNISLKYEGKASIAQRKQSLRSRNTALRSLFTGSEDEGEPREDGIGLSNDELYELLMEQNKDLKPGDTIHLPSDILHRRRSRFDVEETFQDSGVEGVGDIHHSFPSTLNELAKITARQYVELALSFITMCSKFSKTLDEAYKDATLLKKVLNHIQGKFGSAIMEYFSFLKWLIQINFLITLLTLPLIIPQLVLPESDSISGHSAVTMNSSDTFNETIIPGAYRGGSNYTMSCTEVYQSKVEEYKNQRSEWETVADFLQGNGVIETSIMFYGSYSNRTYYNALTDSRQVYNMSLAFFTVFFVTFMISFLLILYSFSVYHQQSEISSRTSINGKVCNIVFSSWDHGLKDRKAIRLKKRLIKSELQQLKEAGQYKQKVRARTTMQRVGLFCVRAVVNIIVLAILGGCVVAIWVAQNQTENLLKDQVNLGTELSLALEYLPTFLITIIYIIIPPMFYLLVKAEQYRPNIEVNITMFRILVLRVLSLLFLFFNIVYRLFEKKGGCSIKKCGSCIYDQGDTSLYKCWETFIGQQIYKLVIVDFVVMIGLPFLVEYPRNLIYKKFHKKVGILKKLGQQEFDMPKSVMDALYNQMLCWIGVFFSPFIPLMIFTKMMIFFAVKRWSLFTNQKPSTTLSRSSDVYSFFLLVMLLSLMISYAVLIACFGFITPSQSCGPFRIHSDDQERILGVVAYTVASFDVSIRRIIDALYSAPVVVTLIIILISMFYYYSTLSSAQYTKIKVYEKQLAKNVEDKQYYHKKVKAIVEDMNTGAKVRRKPTPSAVSEEVQINVTVMHDSEVESERSEDSTSIRDKSNSMSSVSDENSYVRESVSSGQTSHEAAEESLSQHDLEDDQPHLPGQAQPVEAEQAPTELVDKQSTNDSAEFQESSVPGEVAVQWRVQNPDHDNRLSLLDQGMEMKKLENKLLDAEIEKKQLELQLYEAKLNEKRRDERLRQLEAELNKMEKQRLAEPTKDDMPQHSAIKPLASTSGLHSSGQGDKAVRFDFGQGGNTNEAYIESSSDSETSMDEDYETAYVRPSPLLQQQLPYRMASVEPRTDYIYMNGSFNPGDIEDHPDYSDSD